jgi:hypothetical protein
MSVEHLGSASNHNFKVSFPFCVSYLIKKNGTPHATDRPRKADRDRVLTPADLRYVFCSNDLRMETAVPHKSFPTGPAGRDIVFECQHCATPLVVDRAAAGMTLDCQQCGKPIAVPPAQCETDRPPELSAVENAHFADVQRRMKENESQRIEITNTINQLRIQFHRGQLRLQTLEETQKQLNEEMAAIRPSPQI